MTDSWRAGSAQRVFQIPVGSPLEGYSERQGDAEAVLDELTVSALVLESNGQQLAILAADVLGIDEGLVDEVAARSGFPREALIVAASHTHSGPAGIIARLHPADDDRLDLSLRQRFVQLCANVLRDALADLQPAQLAIGRAEAIEVGANRNDPFGPYDPTVHALVVTAGDGALRTVLVHYACHPTVLGAESRLISADFPGPMRAKLAHDLAVSGRAPTVLYVNGAAGDISTRFTRGGQSPFDLRLIGERLARAVAKAMLCARPVTPRLRRESVVVPLTPRLLDESEFVEDGGAIGPLSSGRSPAEQRKVITAAQGREILRRLIAVGNEAIPTRVTLEAWQIGELSVVTIPGELFASLGALVRESAPGPCLVIGYANGYIGYLVDEEAEHTASYEWLASPFGPGTGQVVARAAAALVRRVSAVTPS